MRLPWLLLACAAAGCGPADRPAPPKAVSLFAAASTKEAVEQIARDFLAHTGVPVEVTLGPSSGLAKQIEQGASADIFLSADQASVDYLTMKRLVSERHNLLTNQLVVVVPADSPLELKSLRDLAGPQVRRLALAEPKVPAGEYARQALGRAGVWDQLEARVVGGIDVRATLQFVARGEAEAGVVYRTDALGRPEVRVALEVDPALHEPIRYPLVRFLREPTNPATRRLFEYLRSDKAAAVFERAGFGVTR